MDVLLLVLQLTQRRARRLVRREVRAVLALHVGVRAALCVGRGGNEGTRVVGVAIVVGACVIGGDVAGGGRHGGRHGGLADDGGVVSGRGGEVEHGALCGCGVGGEGGRASGSGEGGGVHGVMYLLEESGRI